MIQTTTPSVSTVGSNNRYRTLLKEFIQITKPISIKEPKHSVHHHNVTNGPLVVEPARHLSPQRYKAAKAEFEQ